MTLEYQKFLLFGDSITEYCFNTYPEQNNGHQFALGAALCSDYSRRLAVIHRGFSGYNSRWALKILPKILEHEQNIAIATIFFGSNDANPAGPVHVPAPEYEANLHKLVQMMKVKSIKPILVGPALYDPAKFEPTHQNEIKLGQVRSNQLFGKYSKIAEDVASKEHIPFVNLHAAFKGDGSDEWKDLLSDGLHYNGRGYEIFYQQLLRAINESYPQYSPENMEVKLPLWREVLEDGSNLDQFLS